MLEWLDDGMYLHHVFFAVLLVIVGFCWGSTRHRASDSDQVVYVVHGLCTVCVRSVMWGCIKPNPQNEPGDLRRWFFFGPSAPALQSTKGLLTSEVKKQWTIELWFSCGRTQVAFSCLLNSLPIGPDVWLNLDQLFKTLLSSVVSEQYWARALTCTDLH